MTPGLDAVLPHLAGVDVERVEQSPDLVRVLASTRARPTSCPTCGASSSRVHSRYQRRLADAALGRRRMVLVLRVRRLFCDAAACQRRTFAEQVEGLTVPYGRRRPVLRQMLEQVAVALAGRAGARLA